MSARTPGGATKALLESQTREMYDLVEGSARPINGALIEPREAVATALIAFLAHKKPDDPFTQADYQGAIRELRRTPDVKLAQLGGATIRQAPYWIKPLRDNLTKLLKRRAE